MLVKSLLLLDVAEVDSRELDGEVDSLLEEVGAEEMEEEEGGGSGPATGVSPSTTIAISPRSCRGGPHL